MVTQVLVDPEKLPDNYNQHINQRIVTQDTNLIWQVPSGRSLQKFLLETLNSEEHLQRKDINYKLVEKLKEFL